MKLDEARESIGARVRYAAPFEGRDDNPEVGTIVGVGEFFVFVSFGDGGLEQSIPAQRLTVTP